MKFIRVWKGSQSIISLKMASFSLVVDSHPEGRSSECILPPC